MIMEDKGTNKFKDLIRRFASKKLITTERSEVNPLLEVVSLGDVTQLNTANTNYSFGGLHRVFQRTFGKLKLSERKIDNVLILGFGAGSVASILVEEMHMNPRIKGVELDPVVIRLGKEYFNTERFADLELIEADAAGYMNSEEEDYDLIIVDVYVDFEVPESCETLSFISDLCSSLRSGGMVIFNKLIYNHKSRDEAKELEIKFRKMNGTLELLKIREGMTNRMMVFEKP